MKSTDKYEQLAKKIATKILKLGSEEEKESFKKLMKSDHSLESLYKKLKQQGNFSNWKDQQEKTNLEEEWQQLYAEIRKEKRKTIFLNTLKYAAAIMIPLLTAGLIYFYTSQNINKSHNQMAVIEPGSTKATLILDNGKSVVLDTPGEKTLKEKDGTRIEKVDGKLHYSSSNEVEETLYNTIRIPRGGEYSLVLSDGTKVYLNSMTTFRYPVQFNDSIRKVELTGEAYFDVTKAGTPFVINTKEMDVRVLGTSFNVNAYEETGQVVTTLVEGRVRLESAINNITREIAPDEQAVFDYSKREMSVKTVDAQLFAAWKDGKFVFYDMTLKEIMDILTRWYSADVFFLNSTVEQLRFSGSINRYGDIEQILQIIESTHKVNIKINKTTIVFSER